MPFQWFLTALLKLAVLYSPNSGAPVYSFSDRKLWSLKLWTVFPIAMTDTITSQLRSTFRNRPISAFSGLHLNQTQRERFDEEKVWETIVNSKNNIAWDQLAYYLYGPVQFAFCNY